MQKKQNPLRPNNPRSKEYLAKNRKIVASQRAQRQLQARDIRAPHCHTLKHHRGIPRGRKDKKKNKVANRKRKKKNKVSLSLSNAANRKSQAPSLAESRDIADNLMRKKKSSSGIKGCIYNGTLLYLSREKTKAKVICRSSRGIVKHLCRLKRIQQKRKTRPAADGNPMMQEARQGQNMSPTRSQLSASIQDTLTTDAGCASWMGRWRWEG